MEIKKISDYIWEIPATEKEGMLVPARIYATEKLLREMDAGVFEQVTNVACLPGIQKYAYCMPDGRGSHAQNKGMEENGYISGADPSKISEKAISRGISQLGTLGSGNHYLEIQIATPDKIFDTTAADALGIFENQILYRNIGQPVIVGGSMETVSYLLVGTEIAMKETFGSTMHGSGRTMSRTKAKKGVMGAESRKVVGLKPIGNIKG